MSTTKTKFETPTIPDAFITKIGTKEYITASGLIYLAHLQGLKRVSVEHLKLPSTADPSAIVRCEVETDLGTFADYGEVSPASRGSVGGQYPLSLATTRARNRALRIATGCPLTSYEEMGAEPAADADQASPPPALATTAQRERVATLRSLLGQPTLPTEGLTSRDAEREILHWEAIAATAPASDAQVANLMQQVARVHHAYDIAVDVPGDAVTVAQYEQLIRRLRAIDAEHKAVAGAGGGR